LVWSYDAKQLDLDEGATIRGQRHYTQQELKAIAGVERQTRKEDEQIGARNSAKAAGAIMMTRISTPDFPEIASATSKPRLTL
jgi:DNA-binding XRE family transcriptional regulator